MIELKHFFRAPLYEDALADMRTSLRTQVEVEHKLEMYNWAKEAFESDVTDKEKQKYSSTIFTKT